MIQTLGYLLIIAGLAIAWRPEDVDAAEALRRVLAKK